VESIQDSGANPTIASYNAIAFLAYNVKTLSLLQRRRCSCTYVHSEVVGLGPAIKKAGDSGPVKDCQMNRYYSLCPWCDISKTFPYFILDTSPFKHVLLCLIELSEDWLHLGRLPRLESGLPDGFFSIQKIPILVNF
jgi:hypothetical protein